MKEKIIKKTLKDEPDKVRGVRPPNSYIPDEMDGISIEVIEEFLYQLHTTKTKNDRVFKLLTGSKGNGWTDLSLDNLCDHPDCNSCRNFEKIFKGECLKWANGEERQE